MIEVKVNAAKYAHVFFGIFPTGTSIKFYFKNNMLEYENNLKYYGTKKVNFIHVYFILREELSDFVIIKSPISHNSFFKENEYFIFEFPDDYPEEDLFYFKMKYG